MKKIICLLLLCSMALCLFGCPNNSANSTTTTTTQQTPPAQEDIFTKSEGVMTWEEYMAAELESEVVIEAFIQGKQAWWYNSDKSTGLGTFYLQDNVGGYFLYELPCTEEEYNALTVGTKVRVTGYKAEWAGEIEIIDATIEVLEGTYVATPVDVTEYLCSDDIDNYQNMLVEFKNLKVLYIEYQNGTRGKDIYVTLDYIGTQHQFCVESYLTGPDSALYQAVESLKEGDIVDIVGFAYWYNNINTHITGITVK